MQRTAQTLDVYLTIHWAAIPLKAFKQGDVSFSTTFITSKCIDIAVLKNNHLKIFFSLFDMQLKALILSLLPVYESSAFLKEV